MRRSKGRRHIELTEQGERFIATARKWRELWRETRELAAGEQKTQLRLISVGSVSTYLLPPVFKSFLQQNDGCTICFNYQHSLEAYRCMDRGEADLALISDDMYLKGIETVPAFRRRSRRATPRSCTRRSWTLGWRSACPGTRSTTSGTTSGSTLPYARGRCWTR